MKKIIFNYLYRGEKREKMILLENIYTMICDGKYKKQCDAIAERAAALRACNDEADAANDDRLPTVIFGETENATYSGLVTLSFRCTDHILAKEKMHTASLIPQTLLTFRSASGRSLVIIIGTCRPDGTLPADPKEAIYFHQYAYYSISLYYKAHLGLELEMKSPHIDSKCLMSADADAYYNPHATPMIFVQPQNSLEATLQRKLARTHIAGTADANCSTVKYGTKDALPGYDRHKMDITRFHFCFAETVNEKHDEIDDFAIALATRCMHNSLGQEFALKHLLMYSEYSSYEVLLRKCFSCVYSQPDHRTELSIPQMTVEMRRMTDFLQRRFRLRRNSITGSAEYIEEGKYMFDWKPLTKEVINSMAIDAIDEGIAIWDKDIRRYLESTYVYEYDPIADYLDALPEWDGHDRVSELARRLPTGNAVWEKNFHTWMLALVAQWTGKNDMHGNTMVPLLIGKQGDAKSTFCRLLLPEELREYYTDRIDFTNRNDAERALSRYALINIDEFDSITKRQVAFLKHILQKTSIMNRKLYQSVIASQKRYSSFIATTNDPAPLTDPTGSRRYMCVRTSGVIDTETPIEYPQVYAQLRQELKEGKKCYFDREEESEIQRANEAFQDFDVLPDIFAHCYRKPKPDEKGIYMGVSQILHQLRKTSLAVKEDRPTLSKLGKMLRQNEYSFKHTNVGNMYEVMVKLPV